MSCKIIAIYKMCIYERGLNFIMTGIQAFYQNISSHYKIVSWPKDFRINKNAFEFSLKQSQILFLIWNIGMVLYILGHVQYRKKEQTQLHIQMYLCYKYTFPWNSIRKNVNYSLRCPHKGRMIINVSIRRVWLKYTCICMKMYEFWHDQSVYVTSTITLLWHLMLAYKK